MTETMRVAGTVALLLFILLFRDFPYDAWYMNVVLGFLFAEGIDLLYRGLVRDVTKR